MRYDATLPGVLLAKCTKSGPGLPVDASDILRYAQSPFSFYCDTHADEASKDPPDPIADMTAKRAHTHREKILKKMYPVTYSTEDLSEKDAFGKALHLMVSGAHAMMGCPLLHMPSGMSAVPDVLERKRGSSVFGNHHYVVTNIENVIEPAPHHQLRAAFCSLLIGRIQERDPDEFAIINAAGDSRWFKFAKLRRGLDAAVDGARKALSGEKPPAIFGTGLYPWRRYNDRTARELGDISLVRGIGPAIRSTLLGAGIRTVNDMSRVGRDTLMQIEGIGDKKASLYMASAEALLTDNPVQIEPVPNLPAERTEVFLNVEGTDAIFNENPRDYLLGALVRRDGREKYFSFVALEGEGRMYRDFLRLVGDCRGGVAYHWNAYEETHLENLQDKYGCGQDVLAGCPLHDLRQEAISAYAFPVPGTDLKDISECIGYRWTCSDRGPAASAILYDKYMRDQSANADALEYVLEYSRDKCAALATVRDWLASQSS